MINLRSNTEWDRVNGLLSVSQYPEQDLTNNALWVMLNGDTGNFCLDYSEENFEHDLAHRRAWSSDTGYYVKILPNDIVKVTRWWDRYTEELPIKKVQENLPRFYKAITRPEPKATSGVIPFSKSAFITLRNCLHQKDNGHIAIRAFMYLLAALEQKVEKPENVDSQFWHLESFDSSLIAAHEWEWIYKSFENGTSGIKPSVSLILRHASNKLFQEAHREATRRDVQLSMFGGSNRKYDGQVLESAFYTPTPLVRTIVQESLWALDKVRSLTERTTLRILDPACGSSEFLREVLRQLKMNKYQGEVSISGWDISPIACEMSRFVLHYENNKEWSGKVNITIEQKDSSEFNWQEVAPFDLILMNPPFKIFDKQNPKNGFVIEQLKGLGMRQPDLAALFWKKASESLADDGAIGLVVPHSLIRAETYQSLRSYITRNLGITFSLVGRLGSAGLFENAMIIPSVLVGAKVPKIPNHTVLWTDHQQSSVYNSLRELRKYRLESFPTPIADSDFSIYENELITSSDSWVVRSFEMFQLSEKLKNFNTVDKIFTVTRGADAGKNAAFIIKKYEFQALQKKERKYFRPCAMNSSIVNGKLLDKLYVFFPYDDCLIASEEQLREVVPSYYENWLKPYSKELKDRPGFEEKWWELNRPRSFQNSIKLVSSRFGKSDLFAFDSKGEFVIVQGFGWILKREDIDKEQYYFAYLAILSAPLTESLFRMVCNVLEGGYFDLSKRYVDKMPIPDLTKVAPELLSDLIMYGKSIHAGKMIDSQLLNQITATAYGLDEKMFTVKA